MESNLTAFSKAREKLRQLTESFLDVLSKDRIEVLFLLMATFFGIIVSMCLAYVSGDKDTAVKLLSPLIICIGVFVALDNLLTTENAKITEKRREESRFRFENCIKMLDRLGELLDEPKRYEFPHTHTKWSTSRLEDAIAVIHAYEELKGGVIDEHLQSLYIEERFFKANASRHLKASTPRDFYGLSDGNRDSDDMKSRLEAHHTALEELKKQGLTELLDEWKPKGDCHLPKAVSLSALLAVIAFFTDTDGMDKSEFKDSLRELGYPGVTEYLELYHRAYTDSEDRLQFKV